MDATNGQFAHCPLPRGMGETGYYLLWEHHQQQGLLQSRDTGRRCFWIGHAKKWLEGLDYFPDNFFELWDIYEEFSCPSNLEFLHSVDVQRRATEGRKKHWQSPEGETRKKKIKQRKIHNQRKVEVTFADGRVGVYPTCRFAAEALGVTAGSVTYWAQGKVTPSLPISVRYA